jgi:small subunit ribosomal protein S8
MQDPLSDMFTRIRNAHMAGHTSVEMPSSKLKVAVVQVLLDEGYIGHFSVEGDIKKVLSIVLKYHNERPVIERIERFSKPSLRRYSGQNNLPKVELGLGISIISTSKGVMTDRAARLAGVGGEVLATVF